MTGPDKVMTREGVFWLLLSLLPLMSAQLQWKLQKNASGIVPEARRDAAIGYDQTANQIILFGGRSVGSLGDTWIYNITSRQTFVIHHPEDRVCPVGVCDIEAEQIHAFLSFHNHRLYLVIGCDKHPYMFWRYKNSLNSLAPEAFSHLADYLPVADSWRELSMQIMPAPRSCMVYGTSDGYLYIATGEKREPTKTFYNDIWRFSFRSETWEKLPPLSQPNVHPTNWNKSLHTLLKPGERYGAAGGIYPGSFMFYVHQGFANKNYFDTFTYNVDKLDWHRENCRVGYCNSYDPRYPHARYLHAGTMLDTNMLLIFGGCLTGGGTGGPCPSGDSWMFNGKSLDWARVKGCPAPRIYSSMVMLPIVANRKRVVMYGGLENGPQVIKTTTSAPEEVAVFDVADETWSIRNTIADNGLYPTKRASVSMVTGETGVFMYGGIEVDSENMMSDLWLLEGDSDSADQSLLMQCPQHFINMILLHGIFMVVGWGFFLQWGLFLARYFRSSKNRMWFYVHITFQVFGLMCCIAGLVFAILSVQFDHFEFAHGIIGLVVMGLGIIQPINAALRPHKPDTGEQVSKRRRLWEWFHHFIGHASILLAFVNISLGLFMIVSVTIIWAIWFGYFGFVFLAYLVAETFVFCRREPVRQNFASIRSITDKKRFIAAYSNPTVEQDSERL